MKSAKKNLSKNELKAKSVMKHRHTHIYGDTHTHPELHTNVCELLKQSKCVTVAEREAEQRSREEVSRGREWCERGRGEGKLTEVGGSTALALCILHSPHLHATDRGNKREREREIASCCSLRERDERRAECVCVRVAVAECASPPLLTLSSARDEPPSVEIDKGCGCGEYRVTLRCCSRHSQHTHTHT